MSKAKIKEIFTSIQGEGPYVGCKQLFIRFCGCNLKCNYCDTDFLSDENCIEYTPKLLADEVNKYKEIHSVSLTGGEPLLSVGFLKEFLPLINNKVYLETNATLAENLIYIKPFIDVVSADIKLESATGIKDNFSEHEKFFEACKGVETFAKIVFDEKITESEIISCCRLAEKYEMLLVLQPKMINDNMATSSEFVLQTFDKFLNEYNKVRVIPQVHKFIDLR